MNMLPVLSMSFRQNPSAASLGAYRLLHWSSLQIAAPPGMTGCRVTVLNVPVDKHWLEPLGHLLTAVAQDLPEIPTGKSLGVTCRCGWQEGQVVLFKMALHPEPVSQQLLLSTWGGVLR